MEIIRSLEGRFHNSVLENVRNLEDAQRVCAAGDDVPCARLGFIAGEPREKGSVALQQLEASSRSRANVTELALTRVRRGALASRRMWPRLTFVRPHVE